VIDVVQEEARDRHHEFVLVVRGGVDNAVAVEGRVLVDKGEGTNSVIRPVRSCRSRITPRCFARCSTVST